MRPTPLNTHFSARSFVWAFPMCLLLGGAALAQTTGSASTPQPASSSPKLPKQAPEQATQRIVVEDASTRIDEVRVGSETKSIDVHPKNGMPAYQVAPKSGERTWKVLGF
ncbi:hypothetical protein [Rhodoferax sp.]|uniref:hypothetical protein n=1 Tax=Rhodoferax sp. TaxID=50421 RepID=UPI00283F32E8|nr:hypothetical protein [Rhodoferax sp.]MDR3370618.1 hypothetical protein [Rhodoferax sp.]